NELFTSILEDRTSDEYRDLIEKEKSIIGEINAITAENITADWNITSTSLSSYDPRAKNTGRRGPPNMRSEENVTIADQQLFISVDITTVFEQLIYDGVPNHLEQQFQEFSDISEGHIAEIEDLTTQIYKELFDEHFNIEENNVTRMAFHKAKATAFPFFENEPENSSAAFFTTSITLLITIMMF
ncbi:unnamed protein product, partial [Oikopleura dioica]